MPNAFQPRRNSRQRSMPLCALACRFGTMLVAFGGCAMFGGLAPAQDRVVLRSDQGTSNITLSGHVLEYTGKEITIQTSNGSNVQVYDSRRVVSVDTQQYESQRQGVQAYREKRFAEATDYFLRALEKEQRTWVRREIFAWLIRCAYQREDLTEASVRFLSLVHSDPVTLQFHLIPLLWDDRPISAELLGYAKLWIDRPAPVDRLIGASLVLNDSASRSQAINVLKELAASTDERIHHLSRAQLWRVRLAEPDLGNNEPLRWEHLIDEMPTALRGGPHYLVGRAFQQLHELSRAVENFLWLPFVYEERIDLSSQAMLQAASCLLDIGQQSAAENLLTELLNRYPESRAAAEAKQLRRERLSWLELAPQQN